jgi:hypothetical protein
VLTVLISGVSLWLLGSWLAGSIAKRRGQSSGLLSDFDGGGGGRINSRDSGGGPALPLARRGTSLKQPLLDDD